MLESGTYIGQLFAAGMDKNKNDTPFLFIEFQLTYQAVAGEWKTINGDIKREVRIYLSDAARNSGVPQQKLQTLGFNGDFARPQFDPKVSSDGVQLVCTHEQYTDNSGNQKTAERWDLANWGGSRERQDVGGDTLRELNSWWKVENQPPAPAGAPPPPPSQPAAAVANPDDEPPF